MLYVQNISIYMHFGGDGGGRRGSLVHFLFIIQKNGKSTRAWHILKSNSTLFSFRTIFARMNNKNFTKRGPKGAPIPFLYEASMVVLIDFIAILLTPVIFLIQILNTSNTKMYLIQFHCKNIIKMCFPQVGFLMFQKRFRHSLFIAMWWNKLRWDPQRLHNNEIKPDFQKKIYYIYS